MTKTPPFLANLSTLELDYNVNFPFLGNAADTRYATAAVNDGWKGIAEGKTLNVTVDFNYSNNYDVPANPPANPSAYYTHYNAVGSFSAKLKVKTFYSCFPLCPGPLNLSTVSTTYEPSSTADAPAVVGRWSTLDGHGHADSGDILASFSVELYIDLCRTVAGALKIIASIHYTMTLFLDTGANLGGFDGWLLTGDFQKWLDVDVLQTGDPDPSHYTTSGGSIAEADATFVDSSYASFSDDNVTYSQSASMNAAWA